MALYTEAVQQLYVAYFSRPADAAGLAYWENVVTAANGDTSAVSAAFAASQEYKDTFAGQSAYQVINTIYMNLFGRPAEAAALTFWGQGLLNGNFTIDNAVTAIADGAQGTDETAYNSKVAAATAFTAALDTPAEMIGYNGTAANNAAKTWLAGITTDEGMKAATEAAALNTTVGAVTNPPIVGQAFNVAPGVDTLVGTSANDTFNARNVNAEGNPATTLNAFDAIDGGAGTDTLNIYADGTNNMSLPTSAVITNIENVNVFNTGATAANLGNLARYTGVTNFNQNGTAAAAVTNLGTNTTATFTGTSTNAAALSVTAAAAAASAKIALSGVTGNAVGSAAVAPTPGTPANDGPDNLPGTADDVAAVPGTPGTPAVIVNQATVNVAGAALSSVTVSGTVAKADADSSTAGSLALNVRAGAADGVSVDKVSVNSTLRTTLTVTEGAGTTSGKVTSVDASASTGAILYNAASTVSTIATGTGNDNVTISFATVAASGTTAAKNASVSTGAGNDTITVLTTGTGLTTVDGGAGNDTINVTKVNGAALNINGGDGNDTIAITGTLATTDVIDGGAGTDTISVAGAATRGADDFIVFNKLVKGFETIKFTGATAEGALDASLLAANYTTIDLNANAVVSNVGTQSLVANGTLTATTAGTDVAKEVFAGTLNITSKANGTVNANADVVKLAVTAGTSAVTTTLGGDAQSAIVTLTKGATNAGADTAAAVVVNTGTADAHLSSLTLSGNGAATVTNGAGSKLVNVDASALASKVNLGATAGAATTGLVYTSNNAAVETIKLGAGVDTVTLNASTYGKMDTVTGLNLVLAADGTIDTAKSDDLNIAGINGGVSKFTTTQTDLDLALKDAAAYTVGGVARNVVVFQLGGDTYVYSDVGTVNSVDAADVVVKLTGTIDLDALILTLGGPVA